MEIFQNGERVVIPTVLTKKILKDLPGMEIFQNFLRNGQNLSNFILNLISSSVTGIE